MTPKTRSSDAIPPRSSRFLLRSRFGQRLLLLFVGCALLPTCAVAVLSFRSVTRQLTSQSQERLGALASAAGKTLYDRLSLLESDLRRLAPGLLACGREGTTSSCGDALGYAADGVVRVPESGQNRLLSGEASLLAEIGSVDLPLLARGQSAVLTRLDGNRTLRLYLVHRAQSSTEDREDLVARISTDYLWSPGDAESLPPGVEMSVWSPATGVLFGPLSAALRQTPAMGSRMGAASRGVFEWADPSGVILATWWSLPETRRFRLPPWRIVLSEPRNDVVAPMAAFARSFPLLLASALVLVLGLGVTQIRRSMVPLAELQQGTRRIAERDFHSRVLVSSGDELEELAGAFNSMSSELARQFHALKTAAEIDRAVLSSVDTNTIVQTVLERFPEVCPCDGRSITLLELGETASSWVALSHDGSHRRVKATLSASDLRIARQHSERFVAGEDGTSLPEYLAHFHRPGGTQVEVYPLRYGGELLGMLAFRRATTPPSDEDRVQVRRLADQTAVALSNARMVEQVRFLAFYDSLTKLPNRVLYKERLTQALVRAERNGTLVAVCFIDLDHFSRYNDTLGHDLGDQLLKEVAARLVASSRTGDNVARLGMDERLVEVARLGGDEFTVVLQDIADPQDAVRVARRLLETFRQPMRLGTQEVFVTGSIGIAIYPFDGTDLEDLVKNADVAMYHAKERGRNTYELYSASMNAEALARMELEQQLRKAVEAREFTIWYQPIVDLDTLKPTGAEALIRWAHPDRGLVSPGEFIALCEECGLIVPLGEWILRTVCNQSRAWEAEGFGPIRMSVNLSARQLRHEGIVETVRGILDETGVHPRTLVLELTESMLMEPRGVTGRTIRELADLGVSLAIDDFGTGYSSLSYLRDFPLTTLKIDRSFIAGVGSNPGHAAITTAIIALAKAMELDVVAEGVETEEQVAFLRERGCQKIQGYLIGRPGPPADFAAYLRGEQPLPVG